MNPIKNFIYDLLRLEKREYACCEFCGKRFISHMSRNAGKYAICGSLTVEHICKCGMEFDLVQGIVVSDKDASEKYRPREFIRTELIL